MAHMSGLVLTAILVHIPCLVLTGKMAHADALVLPMSTVHAGLIGTHTFNGSRSLNGFSCRDWIVLHSVELPIFMTHFRFLVLVPFKVHSLPPGTH
jgi:hypothetical protein